MSKVSLEALADYDTNETFELSLPAEIDMRLEEPLPPSTLRNLQKLKRLGICTPEAIMSLVGQAPIDPINLMSTLLHIQPDGWTFSAIDFSMVRVLARTAKNAVAAALRVDLMGGAITALVLNHANQLTIYNSLDVEPVEDMFEKIQRLCDDAVKAARREGHSTS